MNLKTILIIVVLCFYFGSCKKINLFQDDELSLSRQDYTGNQLRIDGYYTISDVNELQNAYYLTFYKK
jgi:hypothetical protein